MNFNTNKQIIIFLIYIYGHILKSDLKTITIDYLELGNKYLDKLKENNVIDIDKSSNLVSLTKESVKEVKNLTTIKKNNKQITNHNLLAFSATLKLIQKLEIQSIDYEVPVSNTSLRVDLRIQLKNQSYIYLEFDNNTEPLEELKNKVTQYELHNYNALFIFRTLNDKYRALFTNSKVTCIGLDDLGDYEFDKIQELTKIPSILPLDSLRSFELIALND